ncbi:MAG: acyltransferase [Rhodobacter sp.]|nr:acyltransferase [Rhodobacter sp.]
MTIRYIPELDGLRTIAAVAVVAFHTRLPGLPGGFLGVDVFFVLSGYLTASIALSRRYSCVEFLARRLRRLWPLLLFVSAAVAAVLIAFDRSVWSEVLPGALFFGNIWVAKYGTISVMVHAWTLGAEMQFYAVLALLVLVAPSLWTFRAIAAGLFIAMTVTRIGFANAENWQSGFYHPLSHSSGLFLGMILATLPLERVRAAPVLFAASIIVGLLAFTHARFATAAALSYWITITELASAGVIASVVSGVGPIGAVLRAPVMRLLGVWSFGIYLWHYPIAVYARVTYSDGIDFLLTLIASIILAALTYYLVERPTRAAGFGILRKP